MILSILQGQFRFPVLPCLIQNFGPCNGQLFPSLISLYLVYCRRVVARVPEPCLPLNWCQHLRLVSCPQQLTRFRLIQHDVSLSYLQCWRRRNWPLTAVDQQAQRSYAGTVHLSTFSRVKCAKGRQSLRTESRKVEQCFLGTIRV